MILILAFFFNYYLEINVQQVKHLGCPASLRNGQRCMQKQGSWFGSYRWRVWVVLVVWWVTLGRQKGGRVDHHHRQKGCIDVHFVLVMCSKLIWKDQVFANVSTHGQFLCSPISTRITSGSAYNGGWRASGGSVGFPCNVLHAAPLHRGRTEEALRPLFPISCQEDQVSSSAVERCKSFTLRRLWFSCSVRLETSR